ncbi:MAG: hypothetical protein CMP84_03800 [Gammaproteobacteria bacterium]|nr:hypothetical protein [Gammaproteobacteria bacterium]MBU15490.1 hypothetical protein [Gammaproteobacteria bacterium]
MNKLSVLFAVSLRTLFVSQVLAQPALLRDNTLTIPQAASLDDDSPAYYGNVQLNVNADGSLTVVGGERQNLVTVDTVQIMIMESMPVQVSAAVSGNKSVPCVNLLPAAVSRKDIVFTVVIAETVLGPAETCITVLEPFETSVSLDVLGLAAGTYAVIVNGVSAEFTLDSDNVGPK